MNENINNKNSKLTETKTKKTAC